MNQFVKTLIKKYKDPSIIGERSAEEVIHYLDETTLTYLTVFGMDASPIFTYPDFLAVNL